MVNINKQTYANFLEDLKELSDIELQRKRWLNINNDTNTISSYYEWFNSLFDNDMIETIYIDLENKLKNSILTEELKKLIVMLDNYKEPKGYDGNDACILNDPNWLLIIEKAKLVYKLFVK